MYRLILFLIIVLSLGSCYSHRKAVATGEPYFEDIYYPDDYQPATSNFFVHNEINVAAPPAAVWAVLIQANEWEDYYEGASNLQLQNAANGQLTANTVFDWKTMGLDFTSTIQEFEPPYKLSWKSKKKSIQGYHTWLIVPTATGSKLVTQEAQNGFVTFLEKTFQPRKLQRLHDVWLAKIKQRAEQ